MSASPPPPAVAPVLSTPDTHIFDDDVTPTTAASFAPRLSDEQILLTYEIQRTVQEIRDGRWKRIALQFPDHMLVDAPRVFQGLSRGLKQARATKLVDRASAVTNSEPPSEAVENLKLADGAVDVEERLYILADTSYGACCVDEIAAEHADADVVVHYGRSCLSPTARLPVIYVFTKPPLDVKHVVEAFKATYGDRHQKIVLMADIPYCGYLEEIGHALAASDYTNIYVTAVRHDTASPLPNRTVPAEVTADEQTLQSYQLFHISDPPPSLLLTLSSRVGAIHIYPTTSISTSPSLPLLASSAIALRRRYALLTSLSTAPIFGILINTLSVASYMAALAHVKRAIAAAGKKFYTFVVGKVNAAKIANFADVAGWVVIGCWESSLFESADFWRPVITPWELELALKGDRERVWTGRWTGDFAAVLKDEGEGQDEAVADVAAEGEGEEESKSEGVGETESDLEPPLSPSPPSSSSPSSEPESAPPEFDLRTGRYVSHSRPMASSIPAKSKPITKSRNHSHHTTTTTATAAANPNSTALTAPPPRSIATIHAKPFASPAADYLREKRTWQGLGSDFDVSPPVLLGDGGEDEKGGLKGAVVETGRSGVARGYVVGDSSAGRR